MYFKFIISILNENTIKKEEENYSSSSSFSSSISRKTFDNSYKAFQIDSLVLCTIFLHFVEVLLVFQSDYFYFCKNLLYTIRAMLL